MLICVVSTLVTCLAFLIHLQMFFSLEVSIFIKSTRYTAPTTDFVEQLSESPLITLKILPIPCNDNSIGQKYIKTVISGTAGWLNG